MKSGYTLSVYTFIKAREKVMKGVFFICALFSVFALGTITVYLFSHGVPFISKIGFDKFFGDKWSLIAEPPSYGILPMLVTSLYVTALSVIIGVTIGLFTAVCLYKFCPKRLVAPISQTVNLLAGIPSVIFGLFGMTIVVPFLRDNVSDTGTGYGILAASIVLAIMILPTIVSVSLDAMRAVPQSYFEGALALGATKEQTTFKVLLPAAKSGIFAAIGETMAVIMVLGNSPVMPEGLFSSVRTLTANIALGATEISDPDAESALIATGVILFVFTLLLNICFTLLKQDKIEAEEKRAAKKAKRAAKNAAKKQAEAEKEQAV